MSEFEELMSLFGEDGKPVEGREIEAVRNTPQEPEIPAPEDEEPGPEETLEDYSETPEEQPGDDRGYSELFAESGTKAKTSKKKKKKRRKKHYLLRFLVVVAIVAGLYKFVSSDFFRVTEIQVAGNRYYTASQIIEISGLQTGYNIFFETKTRPAREALLSDPYISLASVKKIPRGTLRIEVEERTEYAAVPYDGAYVLIDSTGMVLRVSDQVPALPLLAGMVITDMTPGSPLKVEQPYLLTDTLELISVMEENDVFFKQINFSTVIVRAYIFDNLYCQGEPAEIKKNMGQIHRLLQELYKQDITHGIIVVGSDGYLTFNPQEEN